MVDKKDEDRTVPERTVPDENRDPISGTPGAHPVGVGVGTAGGAAAGAAVGSVAGPVGTGVGAVIGGVAGGLIGKGAAEAVNPTVEEEYWRTTYATRPYVTEGADFETYRPAYQHGWESFSRYQGRRFEEMEPKLRKDWEAKRDTSLTWDRAKDATRDAWRRLEKRLPEDAEKGGY